MADFGKLPRNLYLAIVLDAQSRKIIGWSMANHPQAELVLDAMEIAVRQRRPKMSQIVGMSTFVAMLCVSLFGWFVVAAMLRLYSGRNGILSPRDWLSLDVPLDLTPGYFYPAIIELHTQDFSYGHGVTVLEDLRVHRRAELLVDS